MAINLRQLLNDSLNINTNNVMIIDSALQESWDDAVQYWRKYRTTPENAIGVDVDSSGSYTFTTVIPRGIERIYQLPEGMRVQNSFWSYSPPILTIQEGSYSVIYPIALNYNDIDRTDISISLQELFIAYAQKKVGRKLKFSSFAEAPFEIDGEGLFEDAVNEIEKLEEKIKINRDERFSNLTDF